MVITSSIPAARIRVATSDDVDAIMKALKELSDEIPVHMDTEAQMNCIRNNVTECCRECSWVTRDDAGHIVGFLLGKTQTDSGLRESNGQWVDRPECKFDGITLPYGGVLKAYRKQHRFSRLLSKAKALKRPLQVEVSHKNKSGMADRLVKKEGFVGKPCSHYPTQDYFVWLPK